MGVGGGIFPCLGLSSGGGRVADQIDLCRPVSPLEACVCVCVCVGGGEKRDMMAREKDIDSRDTQHKQKSLSSLTKECSPDQRGENICVTFDKSPSNHRYCQTPRLMTAS